MNINISQVIDWKFNSQEGMRCKEDEAGVLVITEFPGGVPSQEEQDAWVAEYLSAISSGTIPAPVITN